MREKIKEVIVRLMYIAVTHLSSVSQKASSAARSRWRLVRLRLSTVTAQRATLPSSFISSNFRWNAQTAHTHTHIKIKKTKLAGPLNGQCLENWGAVS